MSLGNEKSKRKRMDSTKADDRMRMSRSSWVSREMSRRAFGVAS